MSGLYLACNCFLIHMLYRNASRPHLRNSPSRLEIIL